MNSMFRFVGINEINILELYLNSRLRRGNSSNIELTWFSSNSHRITQASRAIGLSKLGDNVSRQILV